MVSGGSLPRIGGGDNSSRPIRLGNIERHFGIQGSIISPAVHTHTYYTNEVKICNRDSSVGKVTAYGIECCCDSWKEQCFMFWSLRLGPNCLASYPVIIGGTFLGSETS
jgi:hypothetical protein